MSLEAPADGPAELLPLLHELAMAAGEVMEDAVRQDQRGLATAITEHLTRRYL
jgi:hypothetical protein